ncbi:MAG: GNAT family N-acetyltransferase [Methanoregula sp.]|nr:GNAT family N-acetyltransferase [Methanoregula sp.]
MISAGSIRFTPTEDHNSTPAIPADIHPMKPEEADGVRGLMQAVYLNSYPIKYVYDPTLLREKNANSKITSVVATDTRGQVIGYVALSTYSGYPEIGLLSSLAVDPRCRGRGLGGQLARHLITVSEGRGFVCLTGGAFTVHPYSQQILGEVGFCPSVFLPGSQPKGISLQGIAEKLRQRESVVLFSKVISPEEYGPQYLPPNHGKIILEICDKLGMRIISGCGGFPSSGHTLAEHEINHETGNGLIRIRRIGPDYREILGGNIRELDTVETKTLRLHLDLSDPGSPAAVAAAEKKGFVFAGILPGKKGLILILQYFKKSPRSLKKIHMNNPSGERLLSYIRSQTTK